jgi:hypothetical protein
MQETKFKGIPRRAGTSSVVTIPSDYITNGLLEEGQEYEFVVREVQQ